VDIKDSVWGTISGSSSMNVVLLKWFTSSDGRLLLNCEPKLPFPYRLELA